MTDWVDREVYPFESHYLDLSVGRMHYIDEGEGDVILMVHGTPTWSFLYRHLISGLQDNYRVVAPDHLGFGLSDKPSDYSYRPADQAQNLHAFIDALDLKDITLVVHDFGGPIGLSYAVSQPQNVRRLLLFNTWMWSLNDYRDKAILGRIFGSPLGRWLYKRFGFSVNVILPGAYGDRSTLTPDIHNQYRHPLNDGNARHATWVYARELLDSSDWYDSLWARREVLADKPVLLLWGMKDPAFGPKYLERWRELFNDAQTHEFPDTGHFVQEEQGETLLPIISEFLNA
jgi:haloalkane dehalogenase